MSETTTEATTVQTNESLIAAAWGDTPPATATVETTGQVEQWAETAATQTAETATQQANSDVVDADDYLRQNLGYESWDAAKQEIEQLKKLKEAQQSIDNYQTDLKTANSKITRLEKQIETKEQELVASKEVANKYQRLYKEALDKSAEKLTSWELLKLFVKKISWKK